MFSLICAWINDWVNNGEDGDLKRHRGHYDVIVMKYDSGIGYQCFGDRDETEEIGNLTPPMSSLYNPWNTQFIFGRNASIILHEV